MFGNRRTVPLSAQNSSGWVEHCGIVQTRRLHRRLPFTFHSSSCRAPCLPHLAGAKRGQMVLVPSS